MYKSELKPLAGLRLVILSYDLQQKEHRGIAVFSKALLKALKGAGAELWLMADLDPINSDRGLLRAPKGLQMEVYSARVLDSLANGYEGPLSRGSEALSPGTRNRYLVQALRLIKTVFRCVDILRPRFSISLSKLPSIRLINLVDNPYLRLARLQYLSDIDGILCARYFYLNHYRAGSRKRPRPIQLELAGFDAVISTSPSNVQAKDGKGIFQVIHDLIPLEYVPASGEHVGLFSQRLLSAGRGTRFFVSKSTQQKYNRLVSQHQCSESRILVQPPSLELTEQNAVLGSPSQSFTPYRYILFNSSVEPRKNLLFLINAFRASGLADENIQLCVTGQVKNDSYSKAISKASKNYNAVVMTGYVDEATKANLFLNALLVVSPSIVEGFGIPVLDAACLGVPVIASQTASHCEIQCPSNVQAKDGKGIFQVIHDLIPLEYVPASGEHVGLFSQRLLSAGRGTRFFVSKSTQQKYNRLVSQHQCSESRILVQPPSLELTEQNAVLGSPSQSFTPYRYILFNSSVEPRKNLLFLINAFRASGLADENIQLCVTGQVKNDSYSKAISKASKNYNAVVMTGYVDEATKANLFLNALLVVSPSIVEGFGIPVLDAACLGVPVIASQTASHCEIQCLHDFDSLVQICDIRKPQEWAVAMKEVAKIQIMKTKDIGCERQSRIERYNKLKALITNDFEEAIIDTFKSGRADNGALG